MKLQVEPNELDSLDVAGEVLADLGLANKPAATVKDIFDAAGAGIKEAAKNVAYLMYNAEQENTRIRASELALKVQGVFNEIAEKHVPDITINITGSDSKTLINLVLPN